MKLKLTFENKALDASIELKNVPFDTARSEDVKKALMTLGQNVDEISSIVSLSKRTDKSLYFNFSGEETKLKPFFEKFYSAKDWDEILRTYANKKDDTSQEKVPSIDPLQKGLVETLKLLGFPEPKVTFNRKLKEIVIDDKDKELRKRMNEDFDNEKSRLYQLLKKHHFEVVHIKSTAEPPRISLKSI